MKIRVTRAQMEYARDHPGEAWRKAMADEKYPEGMTPIEPPYEVKEIARTVGGTIEECARLPDGSGFATMSYPLPKDHWSIVERTEYEAPPMRLRMGKQDIAALAIGAKDTEAADRDFTFDRAKFAELINEAGKYAYRSATMGGKEPDLDPDALLQNLVVAFLGYWSEDGRTEDEWALPEYERGKRPKE